MTYKTILVHCDAGRAAPARIALAADLAERHRAHLVGLHARPPFEAPWLESSSYAMDQTFQCHREATAASERAAREAFDRAVEGRGVGHEWRSLSGRADDLLIAAARFADLTVVGQDDPESQDPLPPPEALPETVALGTGRGTLVVPFAGAPAALGGTVLLCWNASRESSRAAAEALPLLRAAAAVVALIVAPEAAPDAPTDAPTEEPGADLAAWLARHGVSLSVRCDRAADSAVGDLVVSHARELGCDLVVMGIYGRSRLRERVLGGVSRTILSAMPVPVLMAH